MATGPADTAAATRAPVRIAMWSGPRNISTAMMRAWENRADTAVVDEPLYAHYLAETGLEHPMRDRVLAAMDTDWRAVAATLTGPVPGGAAVFYQKHMAHHLLPGVGRDWLDGLTHCFLIREPARVLASYLQKRERATLDDLGFAQQVEIFERERARTGRVPPVLEARDVLADPERLLRLLCAAVGVDFDPAMLSWPPGRRDSDGVWAPHWYHAVEASTGFAPPRDEPVHLTGDLADLAAACEPHYRRLYEHRLGT
ncbi:MAG: HAD family hydrolase [Hyphomicrobiales bacterium]|nr:HAD family hydrolase [Hyphomicrobiales bacterium]